MWAFQPYVSLLTHCSFWAHTKMFSPNFFIRNASRGKFELFKFCVCHLHQMHFYNPQVSANKHFKVENQTDKKFYFPPFAWIQNSKSSGVLTKNSRKNVFMWGQDQHWAMSEAYGWKADGVKSPSLNRLLWWQEKGLRVSRSHNYYREYPNRRAVNFFL